MILFAWMLYHPPFIQEISPRKKCQGVHTPNTTLIDPSPNKTPLNLFKWLPKLSGVKWHGWYITTFDWIHFGCRGGQNNETIWILKHHVRKKDKASTRQSMADKTHPQKLFWSDCTGKVNPTVWSSLRSKGHTTKGPRPMKKGRGAKQAMCYIDHNKFYKI